MKKLSVRFMICCILFSFLGNKAVAQDIHFSQFYETNILRNPSLIGVYSEDYKVVGQYRTQWTNVGKGFRTGLISGELRFPINKVNDFLSIGILGYSDKAGSLDFKTVGFYPAINYNKSLEDNYSSYLSVGFTAGHLNRSIDITKMTFDNQYQNGTYDPSNSSGEQDLPGNRINQWDLGAGVSFNSSPSDKLSYFLGISGYHFTRPKNSFYYTNEEMRLQARWNANAGLSWFMNDTYSILLYGNYMRQGPYQEIMVGGFFKGSRTGYNAPKFGVYGGVFYRFKDAIIPMLKLDWKGQSFSFSYDINISPLKVATNMQGGLEVTVSTSGFTNNRPDDKHLCPRF